MPFSQQHYTVEHRKLRKGRLGHGAKDDVAALGESLQTLDNLYRDRRLKIQRGFVDHKKRREVNYLNSNTETSQVTAKLATGGGILCDSSVLAVVEVHDRDNLVDAFADGHFVGVHSQLCSILDHVFVSETRNEEGFLEENDSKGMNIQKLSTKRRLRSYTFCTKVT